MQDYYLSWSTPWVGEHPTSLGIDVFNTRRYKPYQNTISAYTERRTGGKVTLGPRFEDDKYHLTTAYTFEKVRISDVDAIYPELTAGTSVTSSIYLEFARDTRDNVWDPTRGTKNSIGVEYAGGWLQGDVNYYKPTFSSSYNLKLFSIDDYPFVMAIGNRFGFVGRFGDTKKVPVYERYFIGGAETVRGYSNNGQIGPPNGGRVYDVANIEFIPAGPRAPPHHRAVRLLLRHRQFLGRLRQDQRPLRHWTTDLKAGAASGYASPPRFPDTPGLGLASTISPASSADIYLRSEIFSRGSEDGGPAAKPAAL